MDGAGTCRRFCFHCCCCSTEWLQWDESTAVDWNNPGSKGQAGKEGPGHGAAQDRDSKQEPGWLWPPCVSGHREWRCQWQKHFHDLLHSAQAQTISHHAPAWLLGQQGEPLCSPGALLAAAPWGSGIATSGCATTSLGVARASTGRGGTAQGRLRRQLGLSRHRKNGRKRGCTWVGMQRPHLELWQEPFALRTGSVPSLHPLLPCNPSRPAAHTKAAPPSSNHQLMRQGDGWSENTMEASTRVIKPLFRAPSPSWPQLMALFLIPQGRAHLAVPAGLPRLPCSHLPFKPITIEKLKKKEYKNIK